jgi:hypothetical protein
MGAGRASRRVALWSSPLPPREATTSIRPSSTSFAIPRRTFLAPLPSPLLPAAFGLNPHNSAISAGVASDSLSNARARLNAR